MNFLVLASDVVSLSRLCLHVSLFATQSLNFDSHDCSFHAISHMREYVVVYNLLLNNSLQVYWKKIGKC